MRKAIMEQFLSIHNHGMIRTAVGIPSVKVADPAYNTGQILNLAAQASEASASLVVFPELGISAYSLDDLFHQEALLREVLLQIDHIRKSSQKLSPVLLVGAPLQFSGGLYNCAVVIYRGEILGIIPKSYLPNYREFYEKRQYTSGHNTSLIL